jgi:glycosidase
MIDNFSLVSWAKDAVLYEVNIRQYSIEGTFAAFQSHLPRLKNMGVDIIWLMPITPISLLKRQGSLGSYYACSSYTKINDEFGKIEDFILLVKEAHNLGLKVIIDWVANHTGCDHEWTKNHPEFYQQDAEGNFTERNGWKDVIDLNFENDEMQDALIEAMQYWIIECDIDGFRCDMAHLVPLHFWKTARTKCDSIKKLFWLAECDDENYFEVFDVNYAWSWMHLTEKLMKSEINLNDLITNLASYTSLPKNKLKLFFTSNHDENSWNGTEFEKYGITAKSFAVLTFTYIGMPLIYSGQEIPNQKRLAFFEKDNLIWNEVLKFEDFFSTLSSLHKILPNDKATIEFLPSDQSQSILSFIKKTESELILVILNLSKHDRIQFQTKHSSIIGDFINVFSDRIYQFKENEKFELMAGDYLVFRKLK